MLLVAGCGGDDSPSRTDEDGATLSVVASFYPLAEAARQVGGDRVDVVDVTPPGAEAHDVELSPRQVEDIQDAEVVLVLGGGFQPAVEEVAGRADGEVLQVLDAVDADGDDPHVWLDPVLMEEMVDAVAATLARADPAGAASYEAGAAAYGEELRSLHERYVATLTTCDRRLLVTAHEAFGRLAARYGLRQEGVAGVNPDAEPDPRRLAALADLVEAEGVTTVFTEELVSARVAEALAREAGVTTAVLNPLESLSADSVEAGASYLTVMDDNLAAIAQALGCG